MRTPLRDHAARALVVLSILLGLWLAVAHAAEPQFPALSGRVVDAAGILSPATQARIAQMLALDEQASGRQIVVATIKSLQGITIEDYGVGLGRAWGIGQKERNNGAVLIVAPNERKVRIEVGYGLEERLTDAVSRTIIERDMLPSFRRGDYESGVLDGTLGILQALGSPAVGASSGPTPQSRPENREPQSGVFEGLLNALLLIGLVSYLSYLAGKFLSRHNYWHKGGSQNEFWVATSSFGASSPASFTGGGGSFGGGGASGGW
jgi:uncharacterized protein